MAKWYCSCHAAIIGLLSTALASAQPPVPNPCDLNDYDQSNPKAHEGYISHDTVSLKYSTDVDSRQDGHGGRYIWNYIRNLGPTPTAVLWRKGEIVVSARRGGLGQGDIVCSKYGAEFFDRYAPIEINQERISYPAVAYRFQPASGGGQVVSSAIGIEYVRDEETIAAYAGVSFMRDASGRVKMMINYGPQDFGVGISNEILGLDVDVIMTAAGSNRDDLLHPLQGILPDGSDLEDFSSMFGREILNHQFFVLSGIGAHEISFQSEIGGRSVLSIPLVLLSPEREPLVAGNAIFGDARGAR